MAKKKTVLKVPITCQKCQTDIMAAVAKISGVEKMEVDPSKGTLTVIGEVEPVLIFKKLKKIGKQAEIVTVGPPKPPCPTWCCCSSCSSKKPSCPPHCVCTLCCPPRPSYYPHQCELVAMSSYPPPYSDGPGQCSIQ